MVNSVALLSQLAIFDERTPQVSPFLRSFVRRIDISEIHDSFANPVPCTLVALAWNFTVKIFVLQHCEGADPDKL